MLRYSLLLLSFGCFCTQTVAQTSVTMRTDTIRTCFSKFTDSGDLNGAYQPNENHTLVLCPPVGQNPDSNHLSISFNSIDLGAGDMLCFFDGIGVNAPSLGCFSNFSGTVNTLIRATAPNASGCITATFNSNGTDQRTGWDANVICDYACQSFSAKIDYLSRPSLPDSAGWIDLCVNEPLLLKAKGVYSQNDKPRHQSDSTTQFAWSFGDGYPTTMSQSIERKFTKPGGYILQLQLTDIASKCKNVNFIHQRIRVAPRPNFQLANLPPQVCPNTAVNLNGSLGANNASNVVVQPVVDSFPIGRQRADTLALPDGNGKEYRTTLQFSEFAPGQTLQNASDLSSICLNMEHSYARDLEIAVICPNGQRAILENHTVNSGGRWYLGKPHLADGINPTPGKGATYCWTPAATQTLHDYIDSIEWNAQPATRTVPSHLVQDYAPYQSFSNLIGCPMNGDWALAVRDLWEVDNGYIFSWAINFNRKVYPAVETFSPQIVKHYWLDNPLVTQNNNDAIVAVPRHGGTASFRYRVVDDFQCAHDTSVTIQVLPPTHPDCYTCKSNFNDIQDTTICNNGTGAKLNKISQDSLNQWVTFESFPHTIVSGDVNPYLNPALSPVTVSNIKPLTITDVYSQLDSVCVDLNSPTASDMIFELSAPGIAAPFLLANAPAVSAGRNLRVCFSPNATSFLGATTPVPPVGTPYTGVYQIGLGKNGWKALNGADINGNWVLKSSDLVGEAKDTILRWSISFKNQNKINYVWTPATGLSCTDCPNPTAKPNVTTQYIVYTVDSFRCKHSDTVVVTVDKQTPAPVVFLDDMRNGSMFFSWNPIQNATGYEVNVNNQGWIPASDAVTPGHQVTGLQKDDKVAIQVRAILAAANPCGIGIGSEHQVYGAPCALRLRYDSLQTIPIACYGGATTINLSVFGANAIQPPTYTIDGVSAGTQSLIFTGIKAGNHFALGVDIDGCRDSLYFHLDEPPAMKATFQVDSVKCNGTKTGKITTLVSGGTGTMRYNWNNSADTTAIRDSVRVGTYLVTITDQKNCPINESVQVFEPALLTNTFGVDSVRCMSGNTGRAWAKPRGGVRPYFYTWDNTPRSIQDTANQLISKWYHVTIMDNKTCLKKDSVFIPEPDSLQIRLTMTPIACFNGSTGQARANPIGGTAPFQIRWSNGDVGLSAKALRSSRYDVTVTDGHGCIESTSFNVPQSPALVSTITTSKPNCYGANDGVAQVKTRGGFGLPNQFVYIWDGVDGDSIGRNLSAGTHQFIVQDLNLCRDTQRFTLAQPDALTFTSLRSTPAACSALPTGIAAVAVVGGAGGTYKYEWTLQNVPVGTTALIQNLRSGWYVVTVRDSNNCLKRDSVFVGESPALVVDTVEITQPNCFGGTNGAAKIVVHGGSAGYTYRWNDGLGQTGSSALGLRAGNYAVTVTDTKGCTKIVNTVVSEPEKLVATGGFTPVRCRNGSDGAAFPTVVGGTRQSGAATSYNYEWAHNSTLRDSVASQLRAGSYQVSVRDANGCLSVATMTLTEPATAVTSTVTQTVKGCHRSYAGEARVNPNGGSAGYSYRWSNNAATQVATGFAAGLQFVTVTDSRGCPTVDSVNIQTYDSIRVYVAKVDPTCFGKMNGIAQLDSVRGGVGNGVLGAYGYQWNTIPVQITPTASNLAGDRSYTVTVTDAANCQSTSTVDLVTPTKILLATEVKNVSCFGFANGSATVKVINGLDRFAFRWDSAAAGQTRARALNLIAGNYQVTATDTVTGCSGNAVLTITQPSSLRINSSRLTPNLCVGDLLGAIQLQIVGGTPKYNIKWSNGDSSTSISRLRAGTYAVTIKDVNECTLIDSLQLRQPNGIVVTNEVKPVKCYGNADGTITLTAIGGTPPYRYSTDNVIYNGINKLVGLKSGDYNIYAVDNNNCQWFDRVTVPTPPKFTIEVGPDRTILLGDSTRLSADAHNARGNVVFTWKAPYDSTLSCKICPAPMSKPLFTILYNVSAKDTAGCIATDALTVTVEKPRLVAIPTGFTPNGDGFNDVFYVHGRDGVKVKVFKIYDRWGEMVFSAMDFKPNDATYGWDGTFHGEPMNTGVFVWTLEVQYLDGATDVFKGNFTLLR
jgi:gliding motility-associated-like protein